MIYAGKQITSSADQLQKVSVEHLYNSIRRPKEDIEAKVRQLRVIAGIDKKRYSALKRELPYVVCGCFNPAFRRTENFAYIEYFIVDIDHISMKNETVGKLRAEIEKDCRVLLSFLSPGEDGLKLLFKLKERCYDSGIYSLFYKIFVREFAKTYHLEQVIDAKTCDVCRACFISVDPDIYYNPDADPVDLKSFVNEETDYALYDEKRRVEREIREDGALANCIDAPASVDETDAPMANKEPDDDTIAKIKGILNLGKPMAQKAPVHVPEQLNDIIGDLKRHIEATGVQVTEIINISYGKKIRMRLGLKQAETNVFYGKKGYTVVISPRQGTNVELNELMKQLIDTFFIE